MRKLRAIQDWLRAEAAPIVWIDPVNLKRTMIAAPGETVEVSAYREGEFTAPLYTHPPAKVPEGHAAIPRDVAEAHGMYLVSYSWLKHNAPEQLTTPEAGNEWINDAEPFWVRGFQGWKGKDFYNHEFSIQKSSLASEDCIWFGLSAADPKVLHGDARKLGVETSATSGWVRYPIPEKVSLNTRMHLSRDQVKALLPVLHHFVQTGDLPQPPKAQRGSDHE